MTKKIKARDYDNHRDWYYDYSKNNTLYGGLAEVIVEKLDEWYETKPEFEDHVIKYWKWKKKYELTMIFLNWKVFIPSLIGFVVMSHFVLVWFSK